MDFEVCYPGKFVYIGILISSLNILSNILKFREIIPPRVFNHTKFVPLYSSHITLARFATEDGTLSEKTSLKILSALRNTMADFKYRNLMCIPSRYYFGEESSSVKIYFESDTTSLLNEIRFSIIHHATEEGLSFCDLQKFVPHITIIRSMLDRDKDEIRNCIYKVNKDVIPLFYISNICVLSPERRLARNSDRLIASKAKELSVEFD